ncbi:MAG: AI-2E family transporter [Syntrophobacteraceae bacterium]|nr:AI-2E family transporter [Syntrophobacteraceae bacterium]
MGSLAAAAIVWYAREIVYLLFAGILVAIFFRRTSAWISRKSGLNVRICLAVLVLALVGFIFSVIFFLGPNIANQLSKLISSMPAAIKKVHEIIAHSPLGRTFSTEFAGAEKLGSSVSSIAGKAAGYLFTTLGATTSLFAILVFGLYMAVEPDLYLRGILRLVARSNRQRARKILYGIGDALQWWLIGQTVDMVFVGVLVLIGLWLLNIPLAMTLGLLAGLLDFVPVVGAIISAIPAILVALTLSPSKALYVAILFFGVHLLDGYLLGPIIQRRTVNLPPLVMLAAIVFMGFVSGFLGILLATPLAVIVTELVRTLTDDTE